MSPSNHRIAISGLPRAKRVRRAILAGVSAITLPGICLNKGVALLGRGKQARVSRSAGHVVRVFRLALPSIVLAVAGLWTFSPAPASATGSEWVTDASFPGVPYGLTAVSCPTAQVCVAVGGIDASNEVLTTEDGGQTWASHAMQLSVSLWGVSCPSIQDCVAVGEISGTEDGAILTTSDGGAEWATVTPPGIKYLDSVMCASDESCVAVGASIEVTSDGGSTWTGGALPSDVWHFGGVFCFTPTECVAVGTSADNNPVAVIATTSDGGLDWVPRSTGLSSAESFDSSLDTVSCSTMLDCVAGGSIALTSTDGGVTWALSSLPAGVKNVSGMSCPSGLGCVAVGTTDYYYSFLVSDDGGATWSSEATGQVEGTGSGLACPSSTFCVTVGWTNEGNSTLLTTHNGGQTWSQPGAPIGFLNFTSISCPTAIVCVSVGTIGAVSPDDSTIFATSDGGSTWGAVDQIQGVQLSSISCPTTTSCMVVGSYVTGSGATVIVSTDSGQTWSDITPPLLSSGSPVSRFTGVACAPGGSCIAVGYGPSGNQAFATSDFGVDWSSRSVPHGPGLYAVACPTTSVCYAVGNSDILVTTNSGAAWTESTGQGVTDLDSISCPTTTDCVAVGGNPPTDGTESVVATTDGGQHWTLEGVPSGAFPLLGVSCTSAQACVAVGGIWSSAAGILSTANGGATWTSAPGPPGSTTLSAVDCVTAGPCFSSGLNQIIEDAGPFGTPGLLRVTTTPAVPSQITVDGVVSDTWGLTWVKESPGQHTVCFSAVPGFGTPPCQVVTVSSGATTTVTGTFVPHGYLHVITSPALPGEVTVTPNGSSTPAANDDWGVYTDLAPGDYNVCFGAVAGYSPPSCRSATVTAGSTTTVTGDYTASAGANGQSGVGLLRVTTSPALPSQITVDGNVADTWGLTWLEIAPGAHTVCFSAAQGYTAPACQQVTVRAGQTSTLTGTFAQRGFLQVRTSPPVAGTIYINGTPADDWGVYTDVAPGTYTVCFGAVPGSAAPPCQPATVTSGTTTGVTGVYMT